MTGTQCCGELEYVITGDDAATFDFVEIVDNDLLVYCDWYTKKTGTFTVNVASRLKWFVTEMSEPVSFKITLKENCNKPGPYGSTSAEITEAINHSLDHNDQVFTYGQIVLVLFFFILSTFLGAAIAYMLVSPIKISGCSKVTDEQKALAQQESGRDGQAAVGH